MGFRNLTAINYDWSFVTAQTNKKLLDILGTQFLEAYFVDVISTGSGTPSCRIGTGAAGLAVPVNDSSTPAQGGLYSHGAVPSGGGIAKQMGGAPILIGAPGASLWLTCSAPTGGDIRIIVQARILDI